MSSTRMEKAEEELKENPYYSKYAEKIAALQTTSPEEFLSRVEGRIQQKSKKEEAVKDRYLVVIFTIENTEPLYDGIWLQRLFICTEPKKRAANIRKTRDSAIEQNYEGGINTK